MPINFTDYANIAPQAAPDLFGGLIEAYKKGKKFRQESEAAEAQKKLVGLKTQGEELRLGALPEELEYAQWQRNFEKEHMPEERMQALQHMIRQRKNAELSGEHQAQVNEWYPRVTQSGLEVNDLTKQLKLAQTMGALRKLEQPILTEEQKAFQKKSGTTKADFLAANNQDIADAQRGINTLEQINSLMSSPLFATTVGPIDQYTSLLGRSGVRELRGNLENLFGEMKLSAARLEKGATSDKERAFINNTYPSRGDTVAEIKGKVNSLNQAYSSLVKRKELVSKFMSENGDSPEVAMEKAKQMTDFMKSSKQSDKSYSGVINGKLVKNIHPGRLEAFKKLGGVVNE